MNTEKPNKEKSTLEKIGIIVGIILGITTLYFLFWSKDSNQEILIGYENSTDVEILNIEVKSFNGKEILVATFKNLTDKDGLYFNADLYNENEKVRKTESFKKMIKNDFALKPNQKIEIPISYYQDVKTILSKKYGSFELLKADFTTKAPKIDGDNSFNENKESETVINNSISYPLLLKCTFQDIFETKKFVQRSVYFHIKLIN